MEEEEGATASASEYWCHMCARMVNPVMEIETIKCPICQSGFVEEMATSPSPAAAAGNDDDSPLNFVVGGSSSDSDRALSLWAPILLGMMGNPARRRRRGRRMVFEEEQNDDIEDDDDDDSMTSSVNRRQLIDDGESELDRELESIIRRRRRSSAAILHLLQGIRAGIGDPPGDDRERDERVILINPFNQTIIVQGSSSYEPITTNGSLGDYFIGPGLDLLLQHLSENDPNRYGTPPAQKEAVEALPTVKVEEISLQCCVCLEECEIGVQVKKMPCKHKFHTDCILPWLELHSSCPICRYQLPSDEFKLDNNNGESSDRQLSMPLPWPFSSLFSSSSSIITSRTSTGAGAGAGENDNNSQSHEGVE